MCESKQSAADTAIRLVILKNYFEFLALFRLLFLRKEKLVLHLSSYKSKISYSKIPELSPLEVAFAPSLAARQDTEQGKVPRLLQNTPLLEAVTDSPAFLFPVIYKAGEYVGSHI